MRLRSTVTLIVGALLCVALLHFPRNYQRTTTTVQNIPQFEITFNATTSSLVEHCDRNRARRTTRVKGPFEVMTILGQKPQTDRTNIAFLTPNCELVDIATLSPPSTGFIGTAKWACRGAWSLVNRLSTSESQLVFVSYAVSDLPGQSLEMILDSIGGLFTELLVTPIKWSKITVILHNYSEIGLYHASSYIRMLEQSIPILHKGRVNLEILRASAVVPLVVRLTAGSELVFSSPVVGSSPCQVVAQEFLWRSLQYQIGLEYSNPSHNTVLIFKTNRSIGHHTPQFFDINSLQPAANRIILPENIDKSQRLWYLNHAERIIDSAGANGDINRLLLTPRRHLSHVCWVTFVHPESHLVAFCRTTPAEPVPGFRRSYYCPRSSTLDDSALNDGLKLCDA